MANPILKIKRNKILTGVVPSSLVEGELGVDFVDNKFYIGTQTTNPILSSTQIVDDSTFPVANNNFVPTEKAVKTYITNNYNPQQVTIPPKNVFQMRIPSLGVNIQGDEYSPLDLYTENINFFIDQNTNSFIKVGENVNLSQYGTGLYQTTANNMYLHVSYSVVIKSVTASNITTETDINKWRSFGMYVISYNTGSKIYYGCQTTPPALAAPNGLPTMLNGSAIVKLPKYRYGFQTGDGSIIDQWELRFFSRIQSSDTMYIGNVLSGSSVNDPAIRDDYKIKIEIVKLAED